MHEVLSSRISKISFTSLAKKNKGLKTYNKCFIEIGNELQIIDEKLFVRYVMLIYRGDKYPEYARVIFNK